MDRKEYWNAEYTKYWKNLTEEANDKNGDKTHVKKVAKGDYKTVGEEQAIEYFSKLDYDKKDKLLDYGCGFGRFFEYFSGKSEYYGIDISESMILECAKRYPDSKDRFIVAEGEELPFENNFFDKIICYGVFDACYQEQALKEMFRVLKINGKILLSGKNTSYYCDDEQAYVAEEAARKKGHPNYFTDVKKMLDEIKDYVEIEKQYFFLKRGDMAKKIFKCELPEEFYEWLIVINKKSDLPMADKFEKISDMYSNTWLKKNGKTFVG